MKNLRIFRHKKTGNVIEHGVSFRKNLVGKMLKLEFSLFSHLANKILLNDIKVDLSMLGR